MKKQISFNQKDLEIIIKTHFAWDIVNFVGVNENGSLIFDCERVENE